VATLQGYANGIWSVALSADGRLLASGSWDGAITLWETRGGRSLMTLHGHTGAVPGLALSADGLLLASGSFDGTAKLWEIDRGQLVATLQGHTGAAHGVALSADGRLLASGSLDGTIKLWAVQGQQLLATLHGHTAGVSTVALSADGRLLASSSFDGTIKLWAVDSGQLLATLHGHTSGVHAVALSGDGRLVVSGSLDGTVKVWETSSGQLVATLEGHAGGVYSVALSTDGLLLASGSFDGAITLWETRGGRLLATLQGHTSAVRGVALSEDGRLVASGSYDGVVKVWETGSGAVLHTLRDDRCYERLDISGLTGVTGAQRAVLLALGAIEQPPPVQTTSSPTAVQVVAAPLPIHPLGNLPPARTSFVGRAVDLAALMRALTPETDAGGRLLTLSGVAGCGKTRLALAVAEAVLAAYAEGVWLVELAPLPASPAAEPTPVAVATLAALGVREQPGQEALDTLLAHLRAKRLLLILDNCEHVVAACATLAARLLAACPEAHILTTSQQALGFADETVWPVAPLVLPPAVEGTPTPEMISLVGRSEAVQLFVERAQAVQPGFVLDSRTASSASAICTQLDGLPLAIELAAARLHVLPIDELLTRLSDRFRLLRRGGRGPVERHQTLQATMDWSYNLLAPVEQALLRRLAVFAGGWEVAAAEAVCTGGEVAADLVLELLDELLDRSLVYVQQSHSGPRYGLLETVRQYGAQQLERMGEAAGARDRHLAWCVALGEQAAPALLGPEQSIWLARLDREHDNLRAALTWALDRGLSTSGLRLAAGLWQFWRSRSHLSEGRRWLAALLALPSDDDPTSMAVRASALEGAAWLTEDEHEFAQASALFVQSGALRRALGEDERTTGLLINAAMEARAGGHYTHATALLEESLARQRKLGNRESIKRGGLGLSLARLALVLAERGEHARATVLYEECLALHRALEDQEGIGNALLGLGDIARDLGDTARVREYCEETLTLFQELGHTWVGFSLNNLALSAYLDGDLALAGRRAAESEALFRELQAGPSLAEVLVTVGRVKGKQGDEAAAQESLVEALDLAWAKGPRWVVAAALNELGLLAIQQAQAQHGVHLLAAATTLRTHMGTAVRPADRPAIEGALAAARVALSAAAFADAWAVGETLPLEQIVARPEDLYTSPQRAGDAAKDVTP